MLKEIEELGKVLENPERPMTAILGGAKISSKLGVIRNLLSFQRIRVREVMTPRTVVFTASQDMRVAEFYDQNKDTLQFSRIPIYSDGDPEEITGYVRKEEVFRYMAEGSGDDTLAELRRDILVVPEALPITSLFNRMRDSREHIALLVDEFGGVAGIVTLEDIVETLLGLEIVDESDAEADMQRLARRLWQPRARRLGLEDDAGKVRGKADEPRDG